MKPLLFEKLGIIKSPEQKQQEREAEEQETQKKRHARVGLALERLYPGSRVTKPEVAMPLLHGGMTTQQLVALTQQLQPQEKDETTALLNDYALRVAQNDPSLTPEQRAMGAGVLEKSYGATQPEAPSAPGTFEAGLLDRLWAKAAAEGREPTIEEVQSVIAGGRGAAAGAVAGAKKKVGPTTKTKEPISAAQAWDRAGKIAESRVSEIRNNPDSWEDDLTEEEYAALEEADPETAARFTFNTKTGTYWALTEEAADAQAQAQVAVTDPTARQALADTIMAQVGKAPPETVDIPKRETPGAQDYTLEELYAEKARRQGGR